jgi:hypothetical protein
MFSGWPGHITPPGGAAGRRDDPAKNWAARSFPRFLSLDRALNP